MEADSAGSMASCPMCGGTFPLTTAGGIPNAQPEPSLPQNDRAEETEKPEEQEPEEHQLEEHEAFNYDDEPWFYSHLEKYAKSLQIQGYIIAAICAVLATLWFFMFLVGGVSTLSVIGVPSAMAVLVSFLAWALSLLVIAAMLRLWLVGVAAILLAIDVARNIRAMERKQEHRGSEVDESK